MFLGLMAAYLCRRHNHKVQLTTMLADSGEAKVFRTDFQGFLAKIYHDPHNERIQKLQLMVMQVPKDPNASQNHVSFALVGTVWFMGTCQILFV